MFSYEDIVKTLKKNRLTEIEPGEFVISDDPDLSLREILIIKKGNSVNDVKEVSKRLNEGLSVVQGDRDTFGIVVFDDKIVLLRQVICIKELRSFVGKMEVPFNKMTEEIKEQLEELINNPWDLETWEKFIPTNC